MPARSGGEEWLKRHRNVNAPAFQVVMERVGEQAEPDQPMKNLAVVALRRLGGKKGEKTRVEKLSPERRSEIAKRTAEARWSKEQPSERV